MYSRIILLSFNEIPHAKAHSWKELLLQIDALDKLKASIYVETASIMI
jgi:hypothetical protein